MTLNITLVSKHIVAMSSDFRLTYSEGHFTDHEAQKIVLVSKFRFNALVQYTGAWRAPPGFDMSSWLSEATSSLPLEASVSDLLSRLCGIENDVRVGKMTFTVAGFEGERPFAHLVSNFQHIDPSQDKKIKGRMTRSTHRILGVCSFATGQRDYVDWADLRELRQLARQKVDPRRIHTLLDEANLKAAKRAGPKGGISESSCTGHLTLDGRGEITPNRVNEGGEYLPGFATAGLAAQGVSLKAKLDQDGKPMPRRFVGLTVHNTGNGLLGTLAAFRNVEEPEVASHAILEPQKP